MLDESLRRLADHYRLPASAVEKLRVLTELLVSDPLAPTSIRDPAKAIDDHIADSLVALELDVIRAAGAVADLGSGAGLPGLPLAIAMPEAEFALVESAARKSAFIERAARACGLDNAGAINLRAETWPEGAGRFDVVTARAVGALPLVAEYAAPLLRIGGVVVVWRGRREPSEEAAAAAACDRLGLRVSEIRPVRPYPASQHRHLHLMSKVMETPPGFPRRPGVAAKRPLGLRR
jgi:16S rRNA (guanine527-N7)-methyltransferase